MVVPFCALYLGSYKVIPKRNYYGAYGYASPKAPQVHKQLYSGSPTLCYANTSKETNLTLSPLNPKLNPKPDKPDKPDKP